MREIRRELRSRMRDILSYIRMLRFIERAGGTVALHARDSSVLPIDQSMIHVQKAGVFLHLYNLVESTVMSGLECIAEQIKLESQGIGPLQHFACVRRLRMERPWSLGRSSVLATLTTDVLRKLPTATEFR